MKKLVTCIYCPNKFDRSIGQGDHVIPAALGEFRNDTRFRQICTGCNTKIGKFEQQMLQCGPERIFREIVVPFTTRSRGKRSSYPGALGMPPPQFQAVTDVGILKVRPMDNIKQTSAPDQLIIYDEQGEAHAIDLFQGMSSSALKKKVKSLGLSKIKEARLSCDEVNYDAFFKVILEAWPKVKEERLPTTEPGIQAVPHIITVKVTSHYFRAIAKIAFHYYLTHSSRYRGHENCFSEIRNFIMNGGNRDKFFKSKKRFYDVESNYLPSWWVHILAATEEGNEALAYACLFRGPECEGIEYQVYLGKLDPSPIIVPKQVWAHSYKYDKPVPKTGKVGAVHSVQITKGRERLTAKLSRQSLHHFQEVIPLWAGQKGSIIVYCGEH